QLALRDSATSPTCASAKPPPCTASLCFAPAASRHGLREAMTVHTFDVDNLWAHLVCPPFHAPCACGRHRLGVCDGCSPHELPSVRRCRCVPGFASRRFSVWPAGPRRVTRRGTGRRSIHNPLQHNPHILWIGGAEARAVRRSTLYREIRVNWYMKTEDVSMYFPVNAKSGGYIAQTGGRYGPQGANGCLPTHPIHNRRARGLDLYTACECGCEDSDEPRTLPAVRPTHRSRDA